MEDILMTKSFFTTALLIQLVYQTPLLAEVDGTLPLPETKDASLALESCEWSALLHWLSFMTD